MTTEQTDTKPDGIEWTHYPDAKGELYASSMRLALSDVQRGKTTLDDLLVHLYKTIGQLSARLEALEHGK